MNRLILAVLMVLSGCYCPHDKLSYGSFGDTFGVEWHCLSCGDRVAASDRRYDRRLYCDHLKAHDAYINENTPDAKQYLGVVCDECGELLSQ